MTSDGGSLENLQDIVVPPPVSWWPPAIGWWFVLAAIVIAVFVLLYRGVRRWKQNAYRRTALAELRTATTSTEVAQLIKRTALVNFGRSDVASLTGEAWIQWLGKSSGKPVPETVALELDRGLFTKKADQASDALRQYAEIWVRSHKDSDQC